MHSHSPDLNRLAYSDKTCFQGCFSNKLYELTFPVQMVSPSPMTLYISEHEWAQTYLNTLLSWARGPAFPWGHQSQSSLVKAWQVCKAGCSRGVRTSPPEGGWSGCRTQEPWATCVEVWHLCLHFLMGFQASSGQSWCEFQPKAPSSRGAALAPSLSFLWFLHRANVYLWLWSPFPLEQAEASWKHKEKL